MCISARLSARRWQGQKEDFGSALGQTLARQGPGIIRYIGMRVDGIGHSARLWQGQSTYGDLTRRWRLHAGRTPDSIASRIPPGRG